MDIKNAKFELNGNITCDYKHPEFGWISFTASSDDSEKLSRDIHALALQGDVAPYVATVKSADEIYSTKLAEVHSNADAFTKNYLQRYSNVEKETWPTQRKEADGWITNNNASTPKLDQLATARGIERIAFIQKVIDAINTLEDLSFQVVAAQQAKEDELLVAKQTSLDALIAVDTTLVI